MDRIRIAAAQAPEFRDDVAAAVACLAETVARADAEGAALVCFPEGFLQGYLLDEASARRVALDLASPAFAALLGTLPADGPAIVFGLIETDGGRLYNTAVVVRGRAVVGRYRKMHLLDGETGVFAAGSDTPVFEAGGLRFGINICHDTNFPQAARAVADRGAALIVCPTNNMMPLEKAAAFRDVHNAVRGQRCLETGLWLVSADVTGERDGRVAWGPTAVLRPDGTVAAQLPLGRPGLLVFDLPARPGPCAG